MPTSLVSRAASVTGRSLIVALVVGLALAMLISTGPTATRPAATTVDDYTPRTGATFNRPVGPSAQKRAIFTHVNRAIDSSPAGSTIRIAVYSFSESATADKLIAAHRRGVRVQLIFDDHRVFKAERRLQTALGSEREARSFVRFCQQSCRGSNGVMHQKVFLFSRTGAAENVVMVGSNNMTRHNAVDQWSDLYTVVGDPALYFTYSGVFEQMKSDVPQARPFIRAEVNGYQTEFYPRPGTQMAGDPILRELDKITCLGAAEGFGTLRRVDGVRQRVSVVRVVQHAWNGDRGRYLATKVADLYREGCNVRVIYGIGMGRVVKSTLSSADVPMSAGSVRGVRTHQKVFTVNGVYDGEPQSTVVWNGSHNWSDGGLRRDDVVLRVEGPTAHAAYLANFRDMWRHG